MQRKSQLFPWKEKQWKKQWNIHPHSFHSLNTTIPWLYKEDIQSNLDLDSVGASGWLSNPYSNLKVRFGRGSKQEKKGLFLQLIFSAFVASFLCRLPNSQEVLCTLLCFPWHPTATMPSAVSQLLLAQKTWGLQFGLLLTNALVSQLLSYTSDLQNQKEQWESPLSHLRGMERGTDG